MTTRNPMPGHLRIAVLLFAAFGILVYGGFVVAGNGVPAWVHAVSLALALVVTGAAVAELMRNPATRPSTTSSKSMLVVAGLILLVAALSLGVALLS